MNDRSEHEMILETTHPSGAEEWYCPTCGRRMAITWQPWQKTILEPGDIYASHGGSKGIFSIGRLQIHLGDQDDSISATESSLEDRYLEPWVQWLEKTDWENLWNEDSE